ncbi:hypothetical protein AGMMS49579_08540 [Spirochaetia bacterium]|nr:hypothetical protein AGMMS49579_08540 [Spirochaetia bacterium]
MKNSVRKLWRWRLPVYGIVTAFLLSGCDLFKPMEPFLTEHSLEITSFAITSPVHTNATINGNDITITVPIGTAVTHTVPRIYYTGVSISPALGVPQNFTYPVVYTVIAADGRSRDYTVTLATEETPGPQVAYSMQKKQYYPTLQEAIDESTGSLQFPDTIVLVADIYIDGSTVLPITIPGGAPPNAKHVKLIADAKPRAINRAGDNIEDYFNASHTLGSHIGLITVMSGGSLELGGDQLLTIDGKKVSHPAEGPLVWVYGTFKMSSNAVTLKDNNFAVAAPPGGAAAGSLGGGAVIVGDWVISSGTASFTTGGAFTLSGGSITGNIKSGGDDGWGAGVCVYQGSTFTMTGGSIARNIINVWSNGFGAGVYTMGTFTMSGGSITGNIATANNTYGGGVCVDSDGGSFTMSGGSIVDNMSSGGGGGGGGVCVGPMETIVYPPSSPSPGTFMFTMSGGSITGNMATNGGGVLLYPDSSNSFGGTFTMSGGSITGNSASGSSGGGGGDGGSSLYNMGNQGTAVYSSAWGNNPILTEENDGTNDYTNRPLPYDNPAGGVKESAPR